MTISFFLSSGHLSYEFKTSDVYPNEHELCYTYQIPIIINYTAKVTHSFHDYSLQIKNLD